MDKRIRTKFEELNEHMDAVKEIYEEIGLSMTKENVETDYACDYLTLNTGRNGRDILWYMDSLSNIAIYVDTLVILNEDEIEEQLI